MQQWYVMDSDLYF